MSIAIGDDKTKNGDIFELWSPRVWVPDISDVENGRPEVFGSTLDEVIFGPTMDRSKRPYVMKKYGKLYNDSKLKLL